MLLNASLVLGSMQMAHASVMSVADKHSSDNSFNKKNQPCKHANSTMHKVKNNRKSQTKTPPQTSLHSGMHNTDKPTDKSNHEQHACDCPNLCADCCGNHAVVGILDIEFFQVVKQISNQPGTKITYYTPVSLPIEIPPPVI